MCVLGVKMLVSRRLAALVVSAIALALLVNLTINMASLYTQPAVKQLRLATTPIPTAVMKKPTTTEASEVSYTSKPTTTPEIAAEAYESARPPPETPREGLGEGGLGREGLSLLMNIASAAVVAAAVFLVIRRLQT